MLDSLRRSQVVKAKDDLKSKRNRCSERRSVRGTAGSTYGTVREEILRLHVIIFKIHHL